MKTRNWNMPALFGWIALGQILSILIAAAALMLTFDPFGGDGGMTVLGVLFLFGWMIWGYFLPRRLRPNAVQSFAALGVWSGLMLALWFLLERHTILFHLPQVLTGTWLAQMWPSDPYNAWYQSVLEPNMIRAAHVLLPAMAVLGVWLRDREEAVRRERG